MKASPLPSHWLLAVLSWIFLALAALLLLSLAHGLWSGRLYVPGSGAGLLPHNVAQSPGLFWIAALTRLVLAGVLAGLGLILIRARRKYRPLQRPAAS
ncbi:hypothetical protein IB229_06305 [Pseudomonas sp. PDM14]|uniref:hypothetical protein n=1 Tax=Pseudomonas sp. PDM14 TaxID=2769288 RepID=UPI00177CFAFA|nr:hypothetical protein [Pseudomonas sp. PDM14]MBD9482572.1 hypothetical protein [Pseudomonas sp. PDM14]